MNYTSENLVEMSSLRNQLIDRIEVLGKVKQLFLIPGLEMIPMKQVSDFYEVDVETVRKVYQRNRAEIDEDGVHKMNIGELRLTGQLVQSSEKHGATYKMMLSNGEFCQISTHGFFFSPRAILRIGMLLRDSAVAKEVRTQLLNTFEAASPKQRTDAIDEEGQLILSVIRAENDEQRILSFSKYRDFMNRHIALLEEKNDALNKELDVVYREIETWSNPEIVKKLVVATAYKLNWQAGWVWNKLYSNLYHNCGISIPIRKSRSKSRLSYVKDEEWSSVLREAASLARLNGVDVVKCIGEENEKKIPKAAS